MNSVSHQSNAGAISGAMISNTLASVILLLTTIGIILMLVIGLSYMLESLENFTLRNPAMSLLVFVLAIMVAWSSRDIVETLITRGFQGVETGQTIFGFLFGREISKEMVIPLIRIIAYWVLILTSLLVAIPNAIYAMNELVMFQVGRINAAGAFAAVAIAVIMLLGIPYFHGKVQELMSAIPSFTDALKTLLGGG